MTVRADIELVRGDTYRRPLTIREPDGTAYDLDGSTVWFTLKRLGDTAADDAGALTQLTWESGGDSDGITVTSPATGTVTVEIPSDDTDGLNPAAKYRYDLQVVANGKVDTPIWGEVTVVTDTTRGTVLP